MKTRDFLLLAYLAFDGKMSGKTLLQKRVYFLGVKSGEEKDLGYRAHYYGPFSAEVADANAQLKSLGLLSESVASWGTTGPDGFEVARHDYELTDYGRRVAERLEVDYVAEWQIIKKTADEVKSEPNYMELSVAAKAHFLLLEKGGKATLEEIKRLAPRFGWSVSEEQLQRARDFLKAIGLVSSPE